MKSMRTVGMAVCTLIYFATIPCNTHARTSYNAIDSGYASAASPAYCQAIHQIGKIEVEHMRALFANCVKTFGTDPWIETSDITAFDDSEIPSYASE